MRRAIGLVSVIVLLAVLGAVLPARAVVIEDVLKNHPLVALVNSWNTPAETNPSVTLSQAGDTSEGLNALPAANSPVVSPDDMTVEIVPIRLPKLPVQVVFALYLIGALVFYTLLVLIAQPGPAEYS
ncbi:MAG: hypothetical protein KatS3mg023_3163 [Armatimonadota bacterium]|nr:MAG: hypothetical protein KatS3mg023_3163 [Armatimonadota bacterium]